MMEDETEQQEVPALVAQPFAHRAPPFPSIKGVTFYARDTDGQWFRAINTRAWVPMDSPR
jgi:hypothetical protein